MSTLLMPRRPLTRSFSELKKIYSTGPLGVEGRLPGFLALNFLNRSTSIAITDPYAVYLSYIDRKLLEKDEAQLRVMKEFQKLYYRVIDYKPPEDLAIRTSLLLRKLEVRHAKEQMNIKSLKNEPFHKIKGWFKKDINAQKRDLVKYMTDEEELKHISAPQGLLVNGEVGCGKSMLMDIFANSLPRRSKMRWHYSNFILWVYGEIHKVQKERIFTASIHGKLKMTMENEFILFEIAQKMIKRSTIFMLDEFMLPDVASAQIVRLLFTYYFKLGGVLVATSNKLPEELYSTEFNKSRFKSFVGILNSRCTSIDMNSAKDYRLYLAVNLSKAKNHVIKAENIDHEKEWHRLVKVEALKIDAKSPLISTQFLIKDLNLQKASFKVYNRQSMIPHTFRNQTVCYLDFDYICKGLFSSSDYITLASMFKTVIVDNVPVMTTKMKNEARRFITLLDALYEAKCQFFMRSEVDVNSLFFPKESKLNEDNYDAVQQEEMYAKTAIAAMNPYRPNISSYDQDYAKEFEDADLEKKTVVNFSNAAAFTGEDEKFAYRRAVLRISEMVGSDQWRSEDRWVPIHRSMRPWEDSEERVSLSTMSSRLEGSIELRETLEGTDFSAKNLNMVLRQVLPRDASARLKMPFRVFNRLSAPKFTGLQHFWALGSWTLDQKNRIKDRIALTWVSGGIRPK